MATLKDIAQLDKNLKGDKLTWVLRGLPVVALWNEVEHLGEPFTRNGQLDGLLLWVGCNEATGRVLFTLTYRFAFTRSGRLMFLVVPSENLVFTADAPTFWTLSKTGLPSTLIDRPTDSGSGNTPLLHMQFRLGAAARSHVIMPSIAISKKRKKSPKVPDALSKLLHLFKELSEARSFEVFSNHDEVAAKHVGEIQMLMKKPKITTPYIHLDKLYVGGRDACRDLWEEQGCRDDVTKQEPIEFHSTPSHNNGDLEPPDGSPPPYSGSDSPYSAHLLSSLSPLSTAGDPPPSASACQVPPRYTPGQRARSIFSQYSAASKRRCMDEERVTRPPGQDEWKATPGDTGHATCPQETAPVVESPLRAEVEVPCSSEIAESDRPFPASPLIHRSPLFDDARTSQPAQNRSAASSHMNSCRYFSSVYVPRVTDSMSEARPRRPLYNPGNSLDQPLPQYELQILGWVMHAWSLYPFSHYACVTEILQLGAASFDPDPSKFDVCLVDATIALHSHRAHHLCTKPLHTNPECNVACSSESHRKKHYVRTDMSAMFHWLSTLDSEAFLSLSDCLDSLAIAQHMVLTCDTGHEDESYGSYTETRAWFVTKACQYLGQGVLSRDKDIASRMIEKMKHVSKDNQNYECLVCPK